MRKAIIIFTIFLACPVLASDYDLDTYYEFGRKGASGLVEEEDLTDEFYYSKYNVKFSQSLKDTASYYIKYQYYNKNFDSLERLDNDFNSAALGGDMLLYSKDKFSISFSPDFEFKEKSYRNSDYFDYEQMKLDLPLTLKEESSWRLALSGGINYYDYAHAPQDELKLNSKVEVSKKFFEENLELSSFYKFQWIGRQEISNRLERTYGGAMEVKVESPFFRRLSAGFEQGMDNTKIYEEREDSHDFKFLRWHIRTDFMFFDKLKASVKYTDITRNYADFDHSHNGFLFENDWALRAFERKDYDLDLKFGYLHKQFRYPYVANPYDFHFNGISPEAELKKKDDWKVAIGSDVKFYDSPAKNTNDKIYYIAKASIEKWLLKKTFLVAFDYRYTFKNYLHKLDITEDVFRLRANYKF